jgi:hypothetical protein
MILVPACRTLSGFGDGDDYPAELGEMAIKREGGSDAEPLHDGEARASVSEKSLSSYRVRIASA